MSDAQDLEKPNTVDPTSEVAQNLTCNVTASVCLLGCIKKMMAYFQLNVTSVSVCLFACCVS